MLLERAQVLGLEFLAVTDHNSTAALPSLKGAPLPVLSGCEITTFMGHFLELGVAQAPAWYQEQRPLEPGDLQQQRPAGVLFGLAHPFVLGNPICCGCRLEALYPPSGLDLLEVWTRGYSDPLADQHALAFYDNLRRQGHSPTAVCGRDWHGPAQEAATSPHVYPALMVQSEPRTEAIMAALGRGAVYISTGPTIDFHLDHQAGRTSQGERIPEDAGQQPLEARVTLEGLTMPARLQILDDGRVVFRAKLHPGSTGPHCQPVQAGGAGVRVELWSGEERPILLTNAIGR